MLFRSQREHDFGMFNMEDMNEKMQAMNERMKDFKFDFNDANFDPAIREIEEPLWGEILALPPRQRVALVHRILLDRPYAELAAAMGCSLDAARANVYQALKKLREAWTSRG